MENCSINKRSLDYMFGTCSEEDLKRAIYYSVDTSLEGIDGQRVVFVETNKIKNRISRINTRYREFNEGTLQKESIILDAYSSATIEGARTTLDRVKKTLSNENDNITKSDLMVVNTIKALNYAYKNEINLYNIREVWEIIVDRVCENTGADGEQFRSKMVYIGNEHEVVHTPEKPDKVQQRMAELQEFMHRRRDINIWVKACIQHFYIAYIHPMCDGNGRLARVMMSSYLYHCGATKVKGISISDEINKDISGYYKYILDCERTISVGNYRVIDVTEFIEYMLEKIEFAFRTAEIKGCKLNKYEKYILQRMRKQGKGAEITVRKCCKVIREDSDTARKALNGLCNKGILEKRRVGRINIYKLR